MNNTSQQLTRLFDLPAYRKATRPEVPVFIAKYNGQWRKIFVDEYIESINAVSYGLMNKGLKRGDTVALISGDRPEWNILDLAVQQVGAILVPIYATISENDYRYILKDCNARYIFLETAELVRKIKNILPELDKVEGLYSFNEIKPEVREAWTASQPLDTLEVLMSEGREHPEPQRLEELKAQIQPRDCATMIYTSGTTGFPKGVMLCHENILTCMHGVEKTPKHYFTRSMSFLPLCHVYERMMNYFYQYMGYETWYAENIAKVVDNLKDARPYIMTAVPRVIEKMYDGIYRKGEALKGIKRKIFFWSLNLGMQYDLDGNSWLFELKRKIADKLVYKQIRDGFGGCLEMFVSGGSAIQPRLARFFTCIGMDIYEGYGLTETAPVIAVSTRDGRKLGTVGLPLPGVEVRILEDTKEIVCRGSNVMLGYYNQPELTAAAIDKDGWFHTGDTGVFEPGGQLRITGRIKTMFKTSMGKFVNPETLEEKFKESPFVLDMMVVGENQKFAAALIIPDFNFLKDWQERHGIFCKDRDDMVTNKATLERYQRVVDKYNKLFGDTERIKRYKVLNDSWTEENGCMTPTLKIKREIVSKRCAAEIEELFK